MKANAIKTLVAFAAVLLFMSGTLFAQTGSGISRDLSSAPGMTIPADFEFSKDPALTVQPIPVGLKKYYPPEVRMNPNFQEPTYGNEPEPANETPSYWILNITYLTDADGNEYSIKYVTEDGKWDTYPASPTGMHLETERDAYNQVLETWHAEND